ncbi:MAG TPA: AIR synthase-related protein, partial [bacterium]|nr:AIR synthase-related protein [bacterium]
TQSLDGIVMPVRIDLAASCVGMISPRERYTLGDKLQAGDAIILLASSGIHANGLTLARALADRLSDGYATLMPSGQMYGEGLLAPTVLYAQVLEALFTAGIDIHYLANITGHGWRKIMRHSAKFSYHLTSLPDVPEVLQFMVDQGPIDLREAYGSLNMGAGFAVFVPAAQAAEAVTLAARQGITAWEAGTVREGDKQVVIEPLEIVYEGSSLAVRSE